MNKFLLYLIPLLTLTVFIVIMNSGTLLKTAFGKDEQLYETIQELESDVKNKQWNNTGEKIEYIEKAWEKISKRIQFSVEKESMLEISETISRIKGGIEIRNDQAIIEEIYHFYSQWEDLG